MGTKKRLRGRPISCRSAAMLWIAQHQIELLVMRLYPPNLKVHLLPPTLIFKIFKVKPDFQNEQQAYPFKTYFSTIVAPTLVFRELRRSSGRALLAPECTCPASYFDPSFTNLSDLPAVRKCKIIIGV
jgi:hypothetical protein